MHRLHLAKVSGVKLIILRNLVLNFLFYKRKLFQQSYYQKKIENHRSNVLVSLIVFEFSNVGCGNQALIFEIGLECC